MGINRVLKRVAAGLEETGSAMSEMASMIKRNAESASAAMSLSDHTKASTQKGNSAMEKMAGAITQIEKSAGETERCLHDLPEASAALLKGKAPA